MKIHKLILVVSVGFSLLVNLPRIVFLFFNTNDLYAKFFNLSVQDTIFRFFFLFILGFVILSVNICLIPKWFGKRLFLRSIVASIFLFVIWNTLYRIFDSSFNNGAATAIAPRINTFINFFETIMLVIISRTLFLNRQSKIDAIEKERLIQQSFQNELTALKNQVNPHFLFNTLNSLKLLVREDQEAAGKFVSKLSFLYRYILQRKDQDLTSLKEEIEFLESYLCLMEHRYGDNFRVYIDIAKGLYQKKIPSLVLQILVENAIKHNEISTNRPLTVHIYDDKNGIVVKNRLQPRIGSIEGTGLGLTNLNSRFKLLLNKDITIMNDKDCFIVKLPIL